MSESVASQLQRPREGRVRRYAGGFWEGLCAPGRGLRFLLAHPNLWHYAIWPMLISLAITVVVLGGLTIGGYHVLVWMHDWSWFSDSWWGRVAEVFAGLVVITVLLALAGGTYLLAGGILTGWFYERLARQVELLLGTPAAELKVVSFKYQVTDGILDFLVVTGTAVACFVVGCIPVVGLAATCVNFYVNWFVMGYDYMDLPLAMRGLRRAEKRAFAKEYRPQVLGLGAMVFVMNFVPVVGSVLLTTAAIGAVLLHRRLRGLEGMGGGGIGGK